MDNQRIRSSGNAGRCSKQRSKQTYKKRKPPKKKEVVVETIEEIVEEVMEEVEEEHNTSSSASVNKVGDISVEEINNITGNRIIDMTILSSVVSSLACPECFATGTLVLEDLCSKKKGLASYLCLKCDCGYSRHFYTSKAVEADGCGMKSFDINTRAVYGMRAVGGGYSALKKLCGYLNMPKPVTERNHKVLSKKITESTRSVAEASMKSAAAELENEDGSVTDVSVSVDGTWQKRGFSSLNGVVAAISIETGKVVDCEVMSRYCKACKSNENLKTTDPDAYSVWKATHDCGLNHHGSAPKMETAGTKQIFERSIEKNNLRYMHFYGDGDSKSFKTVEFTYGDDDPVDKQECIGHYQKRVGCRLRKLRTKESLGGKKGGLTNSIIDRLQNYFGIALRQNIGNLKAMEDAIMASLFHVSKFHQYCPKTADSWCLYQQDKINGTKTYKVREELPVNVRQLIFPIYKDLTKPELLRKCLHGKTQNANESFNGMIWERLPKIRYCGLSKLQLGVYDAVANFNYGSKASIDIFRNIKLVPGAYMERMCEAVNVKRKSLSVYKGLETSKKRRKVLRAQKKRGDDIHIEKEGPTYEYGGN